MVLSNARELAKNPSPNNIEPLVSSVLLSVLRSGIAAGIDMIVAGVESEEQQFTDQAEGVRFPQREIAKVQLPDEVTR